MLDNPIAFYNPEVSVFRAMSQVFARTGHIEPMAFYLVLDWKAPRARTHHLNRLVRIAGSFDEATRRIATALREGAAGDERLKLLMTTWGFRLPTATAILSVLLPEEFTIYDVRVCDVLGEFHSLGNRTWSPELVIEYWRFARAVREAAPKGLNLRDCDRWLWGKSKKEALLEELARASGPS